MPRPERREKPDKFQTFNRPKTNVTRKSASGITFIDYKDTESLKKMMSGNGKILGRKRTRRHRHGAAHARPGDQAFTLHGIAAVRHDRRAAKASVS